MRVFFTVLFWILFMPLMICIEASKPSKKDY